jgi:hypothetical protein
VVEEPSGPSPIYALLRWTIPIHALLPVAIAVAVANVGPGVEGLISWLWVIVHVAFPIALVLSYPWWAGRGDEVALVVVINHAVTFAVGVGLIAYG